jgi:hypothetical protein
MAIKDLLKGLVRLCLAGALTFSASNQAKSEEFALENQNVLKLGFKTDNCAWTYGPKYNSNGPYVQIGRGFSNNVTIYGEFSLENVVLNNGLEQPGNKGNYADVSPNHPIPGIGIGARAKVYENEDLGLRVCGDLKCSRLSEFEEFKTWSDTERSELYVHGITSIDTKLWLDKTCNILNHDIDLIAGARLGFNYATGDVITYTTIPSSPIEVKSNFVQYNQRNKANFRGFLGFDYQINESWHMNTTATIGSGNGVEIGFSKTW